MNGSLKSLSKALNNVFDSWSDEVLEDSINLEITELYKIIELMKEKRNTLYVIQNSSSINDELFRLYNKSIKPSSNLRKENIFLSILIELYPVLKEEEVELWMETYLKPAVDSAGYDLEFVHKSRDLIKKIGIYFNESNDRSLWESRERVSLKIIDRLIQIFLGNKKSRLELINLSFSDEELNKQITHERIRLIKRNCKEILHDFGLKRSKAYFELLNKYFLIPSDRQGIITLLSNFVSVPNSKVSDIIDTSLFDSIMKSLFYDYSDSCIMALLYTLPMIIPQVYHKLPSYASDLFVIYFRITCWQELNKFLPNRKDLILDTLQEKKIHWNCIKTESAMHLNESTSPFSSGNKLDLSHLATLLYAIFPTNFINFCQAPYEYLKEYPNKLFDMDLLNKVNVVLRTGEVQAIDLEQILNEKSSALFKSFLLHPNLMKFNTLSLEHELKNPLDWIKEKWISLDFEDIMLECLRLNPSLIITIPDNITENDVGIDEKVGKSVSSSDMLKGGVILNGDKFHTGEFKTASNNMLNSGNLSTDNHIYMNQKDGPFERLAHHKVYHDINRKLSLIPTNLVIENSKKSDVFFKDVNFSEESTQVGATSEAKLEEDRRSSDTRSSDSGLQKMINWSHGSPTTSPFLNASIGTQIDPLADLFNTHEKLYAPRVDESNEILNDHGRKLSYFFNNEKNKGELHMQRPMSSPTISLETTTVHKGSISGSTLGNFSMSSKDNDTNGTVIDFYQRELLLLKNELEFSSYMKHLNKHNYILLKLKMNKMLKEADLFCHAVDHYSNMLKLKNLQADYADLTTSMDLLRTEQDDIIATKERDISKLKNLLVTYQNENIELRKDLRSITDENEMLVRENQTNRDITVEEDIDSMQEIHSINQSKEDIPSNKSIISGGIVDEYEQKLAEREEQIFSISEELSLLREENYKLLQRSDMQTSSNLSIKSGDSGFNSFKAEINENIHTLTVQYERKIKELNSVIMKYENLLEEKNSRIMHLTTTKPISIPGANGSLQGMYGPSDEDNDRSTTSTSPPLPSWNKQQPQFQAQNPHLVRPTQGLSSKNTSFSSIPIIKGRGGYQKRTKVRK